MRHVPRAIRRRAARGLRVAVQPTGLVAALVSVSVAIAAFAAAPSGARAPSTPAPIEARDFRPVPIPSPTERPTAALQWPSPRPVIEPADPTPSPESPAIVRFRPRDGWTGVSRLAAVSVRFTRPMDHDSTEQAFRAVIGDAPVTGAYGWAEGDTVLVLQPASALPYGARVELSVDAAARSADGAPLARARSVTFTVQPRPAPTVGPSSTAKPAPTGWRWPLVGPITQRFGESRTRYGFHQGIDIDGATGDPVRAARTGRVTVAGHYDECGGLEVHIDHGDGFESWYRHLSRIDVAAGASVEAGAVIGAVGDTGCSLGSHLHFGIRKDGTFVDPLRYLPPR